MSIVAVDGHRGDDYTHHHADEGVPDSTERDIGTEWFAASGE